MCSRFREFPGCRRVTRPEGTPLQHTIDTVYDQHDQASQIRIMAFQKDRMNDMLVQADELGKMIGIMQRMLGLMQQLVATTHHMVGTTHEMQDDHVRATRSHLGFRGFLAGRFAATSTGKSTATTFRSAFR